MPLCVNTPIIYNTNTGGVSSFFYQPAAFSAAFFISRLPFQQLFLSAGCLFSLISAFILPFSPSFPAFFSAGRMPISEAPDAGSFPSPSGNKALSFYGYCCLSFQSYNNLPNILPFWCRHVVSKATICGIVDAFCCNQSRASHQYHLFSSFLLHLASGRSTNSSHS